MIIKFLSIHHFGGLANSFYASTKNLTEAQINNAHRSRWPDFPSKLNNSFIGYNIIIWPSGEWKQYRLIGEETAAQRTFNFNTLSVALAGNFTYLPTTNQLVDKPTESQKETLKMILKAATSSDVFPALYKLGIKVANGTELKMSMFKIYPHRLFQPTKCYGDLPDDWARNLLFDEYSILTRNILKSIQSFFFGTPQTAVGSSQTDDKSCDGLINIIN